MTGYCDNCKGRHELKYGKVKNNMGEYEESKLLGYVECNGKVYLATIDGVEIAPNKPDNVVFIADGEGSE